MTWSYSVLDCLHIVVFDLYRVTHEISICQVLLDHKTTMATDLWSEVHRYTTKSELMKVRVHYSNLTHIHML